MRLKTNPWLPNLGEITELGIIVLIIGVWIMLHKRMATFGVLLSVGLVVVWGVLRDPFVLAAGLLVGIIAVIILWLVR